ncbi:MAG: hypothetical protein QXE46_04745 [Candidatus Thermoplasmatota archaeon]
MGSSTIATITYNNRVLYLGEGYYCSELVWAAWVRGGVNLDSNDNNAVMPQEIINENNGTKITYYYTYPP